MPNKQLFFSRTLAIDAPRNALRSIQFIGHVLLCIALFHKIQIKNLLSYVVGINFSRAVLADSAVIT